MADLGGLETFKFGIKTFIRNCHCGFAHMSEFCARMIVHCGVHLHNRTHSLWAERLLCAHSILSWWTGVYRFEH